MPWKSRRRSKLARSAAGSKPWRCDFAASFPLHLLSVAFGLSSFLAHVWLGGHVAAAWERDRGQVSKMMNFALKMMNFALKMMDYVRGAAEIARAFLGRGCPNKWWICIKNDRFCITNDGFCITNDGLCIKNDEFRKGARGATLPPSRGVIHHFEYKIHHFQYKIHHDFCWKWWIPTQNKQFSPHLDCEVEPLDLCLESLDLRQAASSRGGSIFPSCPNDLCNGILCSRLQQWDYERWGERAGGGDHLYSNRWILH